MRTVLFLAMAMSSTADADQGNWNNTDQAVFERHHYPLSFVPPTAFLQRREVPDALIDPYSVLGVLSFTVYIFYILFNKYRMGKEQMNNMGMMGGNGNKPASGGSGMGMGGGMMMATPAPASGSLYNLESDQNLTYLLDIASKILSNAAKVSGSSSLNNGTSLFETLDYYDDEATDLETP